MSTEGAMHVCAGCILASAVPLRLDVAAAARASRPVRRLAAIALSLVLGVVLAGGHLALLQGVAWASMLVSRAGTQPLAAAVRTTFDGAHPCALCRAIELHDHDAPPAKPAPELAAKLLKKAECLLPDAWRGAVPSVVVARLAAATRADAPSLAQAPPIPPPTRS
jgi:hypothetical protein